MGKQRPCREKQGRFVKLLKLIFLTFSGFYGGVVDRLPSKTNEEVSDTLKGGLELKTLFHFFIYQKSEQQEYVENVKTKDGDIIVLYKVTLFFKKF